MDASELERKSSAITLSDMEVFVFPELIYSLVLANILSPRIWKWLDDPWFDGIAKMKPYRRITRLKQYIMDHYEFNLDLDTWGLTTRECELERFRSFIDPEVLARSNALFGYEGDKYYFNIDIRTHFGLDKYEGNVIPYWKTETVEAMDAFRFKAGYRTGAGECVSLATLYAAALFIVAGIPLKDIYLMATPLHSQNYVDVRDGILTNNRRLVTRNMWFNGTALSAQARRALENEQVTIVAHASGVVHTVFPEATIDRAAVAHFADRIRDFLRTPFSVEILGNFLRHSHDMQRCFQLRRPLHDADHYLALERAFAYEDGSSYRVTDHTRAKLLDEIDMEEFNCNRLPSRIVLNDLEGFVNTHPVDLASAADVAELKQHFASDCLNAEIALESLVRFCVTDPQLPDLENKTYRTDEAALDITPDMDREAITEHLAALRDRNTMAAMTFYAWRDLGRVEPEPFLYAAVERNPVCLQATRAMDTDAVAAALAAMPPASIYDGPHRLAQPDEVWNYGRGDGLEKAILLGAILRRRDPQQSVTIGIEPGTAVLRCGPATIPFASAKQLPDAEWQLP